MSFSLRLQPELYRGRGAFLQIVTENGSMILKKQAGSLRASFSIALSKAFLPPSAIGLFEPVELGQIAVFEDRRISRLKWLVVGH